MEHGFGARLGESISGARQTAGGGEAWRNGTTTTCLVCLATPGTPNSRRRIAALR